MITKELAEILPYRAELWHKTLKNKDGTPVRCRVNGKCKTWKRRPHDFRLPVKYGLKQCFYITQGWQWTDWDYPNLVPFLAGIAGLLWDTEPGIIRDKLMEENKVELARLLDPLVFPSLQGVTHANS